MKNLLTLTFILITTFSLHAQQDVKIPGTVVEQNSQFNTGKVNYLERSCDLSQCKSSKMLVSGSAT